MSIKEISILLAKVVHAHQHPRLVVDQELMLLTGRQQNLRQHQGEPEVATHRLIEPHHRNPADRQHHNQQDPHHRVHRIGRPLHRDHLHHRGLLAQVGHVVAVAVEGDKL